MKIDKIKKVGSKYKITLENNLQITTYDDVILNNDLLFKKEVDLEKLYQDTEYYDYYNKAIKYIVKRLRSIKEMKDYLKDNQNKDKIINDLIKVGLLNDDNFAKAFINDKIYLSNYGPLKIKEELLKHEINEIIIDKYINQIDNSIIKNKLAKLINKKITNKYSSYYLKQKIVNELTNLGYEYDSIIEIIDNIELDDSKSIKEEYEKIKKRLNKKFKGKELELNIKQRLYQKGYTKEKIDKLF